MNAPTMRNNMMFVDAMEFACGGIFGIVLIAFWNAWIIITPISAILGTPRNVSNKPTMKLTNSGRKSLNSTI